MKKNLKTSLAAQVPRLMIYNPKGGVGKTAIAINFALTFGYGIITNDRLSIVDQMLESANHLILNKNEPLPDIPDNWPVIFDFGGYPDKRALDALKVSDFIIIPVLPHRENLQTSLDFIKEITKYKKESKILVIINQTTGPQYYHISQAIRYYYPQIGVFNLKKSMAITWMTEQKKSVAELSETNKLQARHFTPVAEQFNKIANYLSWSSSAKNKIFTTSEIKINRAELKEDSILSIIDKACDQSYKAANIQPDMMILSPEAKETYLNNEIIQNWQNTQPLNIDPMSDSINRIMRGDQLNYYGSLKTPKKKLLYIFIFPNNDKNTFVICHSQMQTFF